jgi:hypothetical protein
MKIIMGNQNFTGWSQKLNRLDTRKVSENLNRGWHKISNLEKENRERKGEREEGRKGEKASL